MEMDYKVLMDRHRLEKENSLYGRYITLTMLEPLFKKYTSLYTVELLGHSVEGREINSIKLGSGSIKILAWSQMHGNESTTTKALFDLLHYFDEGQDQAINNLLQKVTLFIIPMLNPDGAQRFTRLNANKVDLNRDAQNLSQPESKLLKNVYTSFKPDYCLNLHGQRTIFGIGEPSKPATASFLSPAQDANRLVTASRKKGMAVITEIAQMLNTFIPDGVGRYDDGFNINCVGDTLQHLNIPTILFEAGHFPDDYMREKSRMFMFLSLIKALESISNQPIAADFNQRNYFYIPENQKCFYDFIVRNITLPGLGNVDVAVQFEEVLKDENVYFNPKIAQIGDLLDYIGHKEFDLKGEEPVQNAQFQWKEGNRIEGILGNRGTTISFSIN